VDPEPRADARAMGAGREGGDVEGLELTGNTIVNDGDDHEVSGEHGADLRLVGDPYSAAGHGCVLQEVLAFVLRGLEWRGERRY
jgi:hypothetical protein